MNKRIFVRKHNNNNEFTVYDIFGLSETEFEKVKYAVFAEINQDVVTDQIEIPDAYVLEYLPGQFDVRADSAMQCLRMLGYDAVVKCGYGHTGPVSFNPVEMRLKDMSVLALEHYVPSRQLPPEIEIRPELRESMGLAMSGADLLFVGEYFQGRGRNPSETELRVIDTYWSDHCRHTTFETELTEAKFSGANAATLKNEYDTYIAEHNPDRPVTLMDMATLAAKREHVKNQEVSSEINACSVYTNVNGKRYILQFKNETHNHPTEIEPFGGASTCIGGAIRDPLSGRAYVYQAMRISGSHDPINDVQIDGKLSSAEITTKAAAGYSSYGNQIGLATTLVDEIYHPGYRAKRLELGFVMGAVPADDIIRHDPDPGDIVLLIGGRTGRDGIGGATGSSKEHDRSSAQTCGTEVQKGNALTERKIQRLFRRPEVTRIIKKCNDFGAGGVCVAIGELAPGLEIELDRVPVKYEGLNGTEIAISESQERMAVVVDPANRAAIEAACAEENVEVTHVATITAEPRLVMNYLGHRIVDIERSFLDTNGVRQTATFDCDSALFPGITQEDARAADNPEQTDQADLARRFDAHLRDLNICSKRGLQEIFDSSIGATTALLPYGGKTQRTPAQVSAQLISTTTGADADVASVAAPGFALDIATESPYHAGIAAVTTAIGKAVAAGVNYQDLYFTFQEYFKRLGNDPKAWGTVVQTLLGANRVLRHFHLAAIGGKDSMSGTFEQMDVPPTLVAFAVGVTPVQQLRSGVLTRPGCGLWLLDTPIDAKTGIDLDVFQTHLDLLQNHDTQLDAVWAAGYGGIAEALPKMAFGNRIGFAVDAPNLDLFRGRYGSFIVATDADLSTHPHAAKLGQAVAAEQTAVNGCKLDLDALFNAWQSPLEPIFPCSVAAVETDEPAAQAGAAPLQYPFEPKTPHVLIPVFAGTNCEYDMARAFTRAGATTETLVYHNAEELAQALDRADILALPGGFSAADEPDGCAKFITAVLRQIPVADAIHRLLERKGLIIGICNGFQALIKSGLLPYGRVCDLSPDSPTLAANSCGHHVATVAQTRISSVRSPWLSGFELGQQHHVAISHGEGRVVMSEDAYRELHANGQIATQYVDNNPNGSVHAIEGLLDPSGQILGKMGHSERTGEALYQNFDETVIQDLFTNGVEYFQCR